MFNIFKKLFKMKKEELEQQSAEAIAVAQKLNEEIKHLRTENDTLKSENSYLRNELDSAIDRVRNLAGQVKMLDAQIQAKKQYSDNDRNY